MCSPTRCRTCGKTTWTGCGAHVAAVKRSVPADQWCDGHRHEQAPRTGWAARILGR
jgi:hypothetical protein